MATSPEALIRIRQAAIQTGFFKRVFTAGNVLSAAQLTSEFRAVLNIAGVKLTTEQLVTLDTAQIMLSGGALVSDVIAGAQTLKVVGDASVAVAGVSQLLADLGLIDHRLADYIGLGVNTALVVSSLGTNVLADVGLVISLITVAADLYSTAGGADTGPIAYSALVASMRGYLNSSIKPQYDHASSLLKQYEAGSLNYFDVVADIALNSPIAFKSFFPGLACYFPSWVTDKVTFSASATSSGWAGSFFGAGVFGAVIAPYLGVASTAGGVIGGSTLQTSENSTTVSRVIEFTRLITTKQQIEATLFNLVLAKPLQGFESYFSVSNGISLRALSTLLMLLSMGVKGAVKAGTDFNVLATCIRLGVTPSFLGDDWVFKGFLKNETVPSDWKNYLPYQPLTEAYAPAPRTSGVVINGRENVSQSSQRMQIAHDTQIQKQRYMQSLDENGDIETLMKIPEAAALLRRWASLKAQKEFGQTRAESLIHQSLSIVGQTTPKPIDFSDYWKTLGVARQMLKSNLFSDERDIILDFGSIDSILEQVDKAHTFIFLKTLNRFARINISKGTGIPLDRLQSRVDEAGHKTYYQGA